MRLIENLKNRIRGTNEEVMTTPDSELKERAREIIEATNLAAQYRLDTGIITQEELDILAQDPNQEASFSGLLYTFDKKGKYPSETLEGLPLARQTDISLRYAEWLTERFNLGEVGFPDEVVR